MIQAFYTSAAGMSAQQKNMDIIANNISNINTPGYRIRRAEFRELLDDASGGYGVLIDDVSVMPFPNSVNPLKTAIAGQNGYFALADEMGNRFYTKNGDFKLLEQGGGYYLATRDNKFVLDASYNRIEMTKNAEDAVINKGYIYPDGNIKGRGVRIAVVRFADHEALSVTGNGVFAETPASGRSELHEFARAVSDYYDELSAIVTELQMGETVNIIRAQTAYSFNSRALQTADEMAAMANHLRY